jgi:pimeloyl-ACP methyl ester carboxylesterase
VFYRGRWANHSLARHFFILKITNRQGAKNVKMNFSLKRFLIFLGVLCVLAVQLSAAKPAKPYLLHLPGIGGHMRIDDLLISGLRQGDVDAAIEIYDWTENDPGFPALMAVDRNHREAQLVADRIAKVFHAHPDRRIIITSHSGGGAIAIWSLEKLPDDVHIDTLVMLAAALSPQYDLSAALRHVNGKVYVFTSGFDPILGMGTKNFGTMDRVYIEAAGRVGFTMPAAGDAAQYAKLTEIPYNSAWMRWGNAGDHIGAMMQPFAKNIISPLIISGEVPATQPTTRE